MLHAARNVALALGGELRDEQFSMLTGQTTEHMRQRIADFARRRLSMRA
jgi:cell division protein ZipA